MNRLAITAALMGSVAMLGGCVIVIAKDEGSTSFIPGDQFLHSWLVELDKSDLASHPGLRIINPSGDVSVIATEGQPRIEVDTYSPDRDRARRMKLRPKTIDASTLTIEPDWPGGIRENESCDLIVYVPMRDGIDINVNAGDIDVESMSGALTVKTGAGDVEVRSHDGIATLSTRAGDIEASSITGAVEATTTAGDIELNSVGWPITARASAGDISVAMRSGFVGALRAETSAGSIDLPGTGTSSRSGSTTMATHTVGDVQADTECVFITSAGDIEVRMLDGSD